MTNGSDCAATPSRLCAVQSLMQQALLKGRSTHPIAPAVPADSPASVPIIPTHVLDRSLHDANQITYVVICRKVVFAGYTKKTRTISGPGHELDVRGRNIGRGRGVKGEERTPRRQVVKL